MKNVETLADTELEERKLEFLKRDLKAFVCDEIYRLTKDTSKLTDDELLSECEKMDQCYQRLFRLFNRMHMIIDSDSYHALQSVCLEFANKYKLFDNDEDEEDDDDDR